VSWSTDSPYGLNFAINAEMNSNGNNTSVPPSLNGGTLYLGNSADGSSPSVMHLRAIEYWPYKLSLPALGSMTMSGL